MRWAVLRGIGITLFCVLCLLFPNISAVVSLSGGAFSVFTGLIIPMAVPHTLVDQSSMNTFITFEVYVFSAFVAIGTLIVQRKKYLKCWNKDIWNKDIWNKHSHKSKNNSLNLNMVNEIFGRRSFENHSG